MVRKFLRDLFGPTGIKGNVAVILMQLGVLKYALNGKAEWVSLKDKSAAQIFSAAVKNIAGPLASNLILFLILSKV